MTRSQARALWVKELRANRFPGQATASAAELAEALRVYIGVKGNLNSPQGTAKLPGMEGRTLLHRLAHEAGRGLWLSERWLPCVEASLLAGADPLHPDAQGMTPLDVLFHGFEEPTCAPSARSLAVAALLLDQSGRTGGQMGAGRIARWARIIGNLPTELAGRDALLAQLDTLARAARPGP